MTHDERRERRDRAAQLLRDGSTVAEVAATVGLSLAYISRIAGSLSQSWDERRKRRERVVEMLREGCPVPEVAAAVGLSTGYVVMQAKEAGLSLKQKIIQPRTLDVLAALFTSESQSEIARRFGCSRQYVSLLRAAAIKAGIPLDRERK